MEFREHRLDNGLEIVAECNPQAYSAALAFFVRAGSRDESDELSGVSHFLEHMTFKGTPTRTADDVNRELDELGAQSNAYTSEENTVYYATVLPEYQLQAFDLLADIMRPSLREEDFETEKQVILEEIAKYEDQPPFGAHEKGMAAHFGPHPLGRSILGTVDSVGRMTPQQMKHYFQRRYAPGNMVVAAAGRVDFPSLVHRVREVCGDWNGESAGRAMMDPSPARTFQLHRHELATQQYVIQLAGGPASRDDLRYAGRLLSTVVGDDSGSRLYWELVDTGRAEYAAMGSYEFDDCGIFMTFLCGPPEEAVENLDTARRVFTEIDRDGVRKEELELARNKTLAHVVLRSERPSNRLFAVGSNWLQQRRYFTVRETLQAYQRVTRDDLVAVAQRWPLSEHTTVTVGSLEDWPGAASVEQR